MVLAGGICAPPGTCSSFNDSFFLDLKGMAIQKSSMSSSVDCFKLLILKQLSSKLVGK